VARYLAGRGHRDVYLLHGPLGSSATRGRLTGFVTEYEKLGKGTLCNQLELPASDRKRAGYEAMVALLTRRKPPDAIFCTTDEIAYGAAKCCQEHGLGIPRDIEIVGFDGSPLNAYLAPWLTTVSVPYEDFGPAVARVLQKFWIADQSMVPDVVLPFRLIVSPHA
jgi:LacI family transcriptional regulator